MEKVKLIIFNKGDYCEILDYINNNYNDIIIVDRVKIKSSLCDKNTLHKDGIYDNIEEYIVKTFLLTGNDVILVAPNKNEKYYNNWLSLKKNYEYLINIKIEYKDIEKD